LPESETDEGLAPLDLMRLFAIGHHGT